MNNANLTAISFLDLSKYFSTPLCHIIMFNNFPDNDIYNFYNHKYTFLGAVKFAFDSVGRAVRH